MSASPSGPVVTLLTRAACSPCAAARRELASLAGRLAFRLEVVPVADDPALERSYGTAVPVVLLDGREIARAPLRPGALGEVLADALKTDVGRPPGIRSGPRLR